VQFFGTGVSHEITHNISEDLKILRYYRSRFFTFLFFMQKLSVTSSCKNNKSCRIFHNESNKIGFAFFSFFYDFLRIVQSSANHMYYWSYNFVVRPLNFLQVHEHALLSRIRPHNVFSPCNVVLWGSAGAALNKFRPAGSRGRPGVGRRWSVGC
jgi:hypothetical protein